jgi:tRNA modification GTPase
MLDHDADTIVAQCTPKGAGAIAMVRLSGTNAVDIADTIASIPHKTLAQQPSHTIHYGTVLSTDTTTLDTVLFLLMRGPHTFTGQDTVEITCHNNPFIIEAIIASAIAAGARLAQEGEFTKRAVLNNKIDMLQAEAINEIIHANSQQALIQSLAQLQGSLSQQVKKIERTLIAALAYTDASFEFIDEENVEFGTTIKAILESTLHDINQLLRSFDHQKQLREGIRIALIGSVNAGKSSLFNTIIGANRAIVTAQPGTTRDTIEAGFYKKGMYWTLIDTAGLRQTADIIEQEGITRSLEEAHRADIILLIIDNSRPLSKTEEIMYRKLYNEFTPKIIVVHNKGDLQTQASPPFQPFYTVASPNPATILPLIEAIEHKITGLLSTLQSPYLLNKRHYTHLVELKQHLHQTLPLLGQNPAYELVSYHLHQAIAQCSEMTGKTLTQHSMDAIFKEFCIGK